MSLLVLNPGRRAPRHIWRAAGIFSFALWLTGCASRAPHPMNDLTPLLRAPTHPFAAVLANAEEYRLQILVSEVREEHGKPIIIRHGYRVGAEYFYPASTVKLCGAVAALQALEKLSAEHHTGDLLDAPMEIAPLFPGDAAQTNDATNLKSGRITVGHELRKLALVSDNQAYNWLFELVGHAELNHAMHELGLRSVSLNHRLSETRNIPNPLATAEVRLLPEGFPPITIPARASELKLTNTAARLLIGRGFMRGEQVVNEPMNFAGRNGISLVDLQNLLIKVTRPDIELGTPPLKLAPAHRAFLLQAMTEYPRESANPVYDAKEFPDHWSKYLLPGVRRVFPNQQPGERIQSTGKNGRAYGFSIENSYLRNPQNGRAVFVTAVLYTNADGILNDDKYDYETVADPFLANLGELVAREWLGEAR
jgi:hypothetical protein